MENVKGILKATLPIFIGVLGAMYTIQYINKMQNTSTETK